MNRIVFLASLLAIVCMTVNGVFFAGDEILPEPKVSEWCQRQIDFNADVCYRDRDELHEQFEWKDRKTCCAVWKLADCVFASSMLECNVTEIQDLNNFIVSEIQYVNKNNCSDYQFHTKDCM